MPAVHRGPRGGPRGEGRHRQGARGLRAGLLLHLLHRCRGAPGAGGGSSGERGDPSSRPRVCPAVKYLNAYTGTVLLRCRKDSYRLLCSALPFVRQLESRNQRYPCFLNTLHVGGQPQPGRARGLVHAGSPSRHSRVGEAPLPARVPWVQHPQP